MTEPLLRVEDLAWAPPGSDTPVFSGVDFEVVAGEQVVLEGPSGSGKSTLLRCIVGLEPKRAGAVFWHGEPVDALTMRRFRNRVAYIHQRPSPVAETVRENLAFARHMAADLAGRDDWMREDEQREIYERLGLQSVAFSRRFDDLSVGEQQRVCLVRALTAKPDLLLLDEPTSALDPTRVDQIEALLSAYLHEAPGERAYLWVSHQPDQIARLATRTLDVGRWSASGKRGGEA